MTQIDALRSAISALQMMTDGHSYEEEIETIRGMIATKEKQASAPRKPSASDVARKAENEQIRTAVVDTLKALDRPVTAAEILAELPNYSAIVPTLARLVSNLTLMRKDGIVVAEAVKRKTYYGLSA